MSRFFCITGMVFSKCLKQAIVAFARRSLTRRNTFQSSVSIVTSRHVANAVNSITCPDCHVVKGPHKDVEHVCNKDDLETAKLLDQDTKPCPKCATGIFKIDG